MITRLYLLAMLCLHGCCLMAQKTNALPPEANAVAYRYEAFELEPGWHYISNLEELYQQLPPGEYTLKIQTYNNGTWKEEHTEFPIVIPPPFYQSTWFELTAGIVALLLVMLVLQHKALQRNKGVSSSLMQRFQEYLKCKENHLVIRENGNDVKIKSTDIFYAKASGNYLEIYTENGRHVTREKISNFLELVPDPEMYVRVHRSYIVRTDCIEQKCAKTITVNNTIIKVGQTYLATLARVRL